MKLTALLGCCGGDGGVAIICTIKHDIVWRRRYRDTRRSARVNARVNAVSTSTDDVSTLSWPVVADRF